jgi:hypothetical protein
MQKQFNPSRQSEPLHGPISQPKGVEGFFTQMTSLEEIDAKACGHTRFTLHVGELYLDKRYFNDKCTYAGCEERKAASPRILEKLSEELRDAKREYNINDQDFCEVIDFVSRKIIAEVKALFPKWASSPIPYNAEIESALASIARREKAIAVDFIQSNNLPALLGRKQMSLFEENNHFVYLKTVDCHWEDARQGMHWFKFGNSKDPCKRYAGEQVSLDQELTFGMTWPISKTGAKDFEEKMKSLVVQCNFKTPEIKDGPKKREKFYSDMRDAVRLFREAYRRVAI